MTSDELYKLCLPHIGKPWWPRKIDAAPRKNGVGSYWMLNGVACSQVPTLADAILGSAVAWLATFCLSVRMRSRVYHECCVQMYGEGAESHECVSETSLLAAVHDASAAVEVNP